MKFFSKLISQLLILSMILLPFSTQAGMISTDQVVTNATAQASRAKIIDFVARADVQKQMEVLGLSTANATERVNALTDEEVQRIAGKIDSAPAGASSSSTWWIVAGVIVVAVLVYIYWK
jgi:hypothetical protein